MLFKRDATLVRTEILLETIFLVSVFVCGCLAALSSSVLAAA